MTNPNMGTAHGRIKVTYDDRGANQAAAALDRMEKHFAQMNKRLESIEKALNDTNEGLVETEKQVKKTGRAARGFSSDMFSTLKSFRSFRTDVRMTIDEIQFLYRVMDKSKQHFHTFANGVRFLNSVGQFSRNNNASVIRAMTIEMARLSTATEGTAQSIANFQMEVTKRFSANRNVLLGTRSAITLISAGIVNLRNKILGVSNAMQAAPSWIQNMMRFSRAIALVSGGMFLLSKLLGPFRLIERIGRSGIIGTIAKSADLAANSFERLGKATEKVFGRDYTAKFVARLRNTEGAVEGFFNRASLSSVNFSNTLNVLSNGLLDFANNSKSLLSGIALLTRSLTNLWGRLQWFFKLPKWPMAGLAITFSKLLPSALHVFGKALTGASNLLMGLLDGVVQLSKGLVILPGIFATIGAAVASIVPVFAGLSDKFKDLFDADPTKRVEAYYKLPQHLRPLGKVLQDLQPRWEKFQESLQINAFRDLEKQIQRISDTYFPLWEGGAKQVIGVMRQLKDEFVGFLEETQTRQDFSTIFANTAVALQNISTAVRPALAGLRDMAVVGTEFISELSASTGNLINRFGEWARVNRENGQLMAWMRDARKGVEDLSSGLIDLTQGLWGVITVFRTDSGGNFLRKFAEDMERFENAVRKSEAIGFLSRLREDVRNLGENKIKDVVDLFRTLGDAVERAKPFIMALSDAFSGVFLRAVESSVTIISEFLGLLNALGISNAIGWILGFTAAATMLPKIFSTAISSVQALSGAMMILANKGKVVRGIETAMVSLGSKMEKLGPLGGKIGAGLTNVTVASGKAIGVLSALAGGVTAVAASFALILLAIDAGNKELDAFQGTLDRSKKATADFKESLKAAFIDDGGLAGRTVLDTLDQRINEHLQVLKDLETQAPSISAHVGDFFEDMFSVGDPTASWGDKLFGNIGDLFKDDDSINQFQAIGEKAELGRRGLENLINAGVDLNAVIRMSQPTFDTLIQQLRDHGGSAAASADELLKLRAEYDEIQKAMVELGPAGVQAAQGIERLGEAGGSATTKLEGLKLVLQALGFLKVDAMQAASDYADAIDNLSEKVQQAITDGDGLANVFKDGLLNVNDSQTARNLLPVFKSLSDNFIAMATSGGNVDEMMARLDEQLATVAPKLNMTKDELKNFMTNNLGLQPEIIQIGLQLDGKDEATKQMGDLMMRLIAMGQSGVFVPISFNSQQMSQSFDREIERILGKDYFDSNNSNLTIKPGVQIPPGEMTKLEQYLSSKGIQLNPGAPAPPQPATIPAAPAPAPISEPERAAADGLPSQKDEIEGYLNEIAQSFEGTAKEAKDSGNEFVDQYAAGITQNPAAIRAAEDMAEEVMKRFHRSPPKKGPLAQHGDAARYAGSQFGISYASGITRSERAVATSAGGVAGSAYGQLQGDKAYEAGKFLGQLSSLVDFAAAATETFGKMADTIFGFARFISDPMGKGTFFGQSRRWRRDPSISDEALARQRADAQQQNVFSFFGSKQYPTNDQIDWNTGLPKITGPGQLGRDASGKDVVAAIVAEGQKRGLTDQQIAAAVATAKHESNYDADITGAGQGAFLPGGGKGNAYGVFQQTPEGGWGTVEELTNPNIAIQKFYDAYQQNLKPGVDPLVAATLTQNPQLAGQVEGSAYHSKQEAALAEAMKDMQDAISSGQTVTGPTTSGQNVVGLPALGNLAPSTKLTDTDGRKTQAAGQVAAAILEKMFPGIASIGGARADKLPMHPAGRALDIGIGEITEENQKMGDAINAWVRANKDALGVESTIWRDTWMDFSGGKSTVGGHQDHVHIQFADGAKVDIGPGGTNLKVPASGMDSFFPEGTGFGPPPRPDEEAPTQRDLVVRNPDGTFSPVHGANAGQPPGDVKVNPATGKPWTAEEAAEYWNRPENAAQFDQALLEGTQLNLPGMFQGTQEQLLEETKNQTPLLQEAMTALKDENTSDEDFGRALDVLQTEQDRQLALDTPQSRAAAQVIGSEISARSAERGFAQEQNPIDQVTQIAGTATSIAGDIFQVINSGLEAIGGAKAIADTLVRYPSNTEDIFNMIDEIQKFIQFGADIAGAVSSITGAIGSIVGAAGGADPSGGASGAATAIQAVSQIAGLIQSALETVNAVIDLGQEAYRIIGTYVGDFLQILVGGAGGPLQGNIKFLLDETTNQLLAYSQDNPLDKRAHGLPGQRQNPDARNQVIGELNYYAGPGQDHRDATRQMMFQVRTSQLTAATNQ